MTTDMTHLEPSEPKDPPTSPHEELKTLGNLVDLLEGLDSGARSRLVAYLFDRYNDRSPW